MIHPLQQKQWDSLKNAFLQDRLSHAYILSGVAGLGKTNFARAFSQLLLCEKQVSCGVCRSCQWMKAQTHPDFISVMPEEKKQSIRIDQVREVSDKLSRTSQQGGYQVVLISPADAMPLQAANALLKTLEEPQGKVIIFLIDNQRSVLPATIMSRCQKLFFSSDHLDLRLHENALTLRDQLLSHLQQIQIRRVNSITFNPAWLKIALEAILQQLLLLCSDMSRVQFHVDSPYIVNHDAIATLKKITEKIPPIVLQKFIDKLIEKKSLCARGINLNQQLCLEDVFIEWEKSCL